MAHVFRRGGHDYDSRIASPPPEGMGRPAYLANYSQGKCNSGSGGPPRQTIALATFFSKLCEDLQLGYGGYKQIANNKAKECFRS